MKLNKLIFPLVLALTVVLANTGCKKGFSKVTPLPSETPPIVNDQNGGTTITSAPPMQSDNNNPNAFPNTQPGPVPTSSSWDPADMNQDHSALAAYTVHFKFDSAVVQDSEQSNVSSVAQALSNPNVKLLIEGNCDERGTEEYNRALGERRALALREALAKLNVDPQRVRTISYGKDKPVDPGHDESAWAKNRRGDFVLCTPK